MKPRKPRSRHQLPSLDLLHKRHRGLTKNVCLSFAEAARICLARHHQPPTDFVVEHEDESKHRRLRWQKIGERERAAWNNDDDATRDGAYAVAISVVESELKCFAIERAETRTGADYYVSKNKKAKTLEDAYRLEVSGTDKGDDTTLSSRLATKVQQTKDGISDLPAMACVVGFQRRKVCLKSVDHAQ